MNKHITPRFRHVLMLSLSIFLFSCNHSGDKAAKTADTTIEETHRGHESEHEEVNASRLSLNNGEKWQTDESTRIHVSRLMDSLHAFNEKTNMDHDAYNAFAVSMQKEMDNLIKDCKMKGPDHEALHLWLHPVLQDIKNLGKPLPQKREKRPLKSLAVTWKNSINTSIRSCLLIQIQKSLRF